MSDPLPHIGLIEGARALWGAAATTFFAAGNPFQVSDFAGIQGGFYTAI